MKHAGMALAATVSIASLTMALSDEPRDVSGKKPGDAGVEAVSAVARPTLEQARRQAEVLHTAMHATLQSVHHYYYREDEGLPIPAVTLKDVFQDLEQEQHVKLRWLAVEGRAMNSDHKPQSPFEDEAVKALKAGNREFERVEHGVYRRVGSITLVNQCLKCHAPDRKNTDDRTAGLMITIAIEE